MALGAWQRLRRFVARLATEHGAPSRLFFACVVGAIVGTTPLFGLHVFICVALARVLRLNQVVVYGAANVSIPPIAPLLGAASIAVGSRVLGRSLGGGGSISATIASLRGSSPWHIARALFVEWMVGAPFVGAAIGVTLGAIVAGLALVRRARSDPFRPVVRATSERFVGAPPTMRRYAWWKLRLDPVYRVVSETLGARRDVVDLGTGMGILPIVLALRDGRHDDLRVRGVDHDAKKIDAGRRAAHDLPIDLDVGDARAWSIPSCDAIAMIDVLHYLDVEEQRALLARAFEALRPGGVIAVRETERGARGSAWTRLLERLAVAMRWNRGRPPTFRSIDALRADLEALGAQVEVTPLSGELHPGNVLVLARKRDSADARADGS